MNSKIPVPVTFNAYKHHFVFLKEQIKLWKNFEKDRMMEELLILGENLIDFYTGDLSVENICAECLDFFRSKNQFEKEAFLNWLFPEEYRKIELSDGSLWVVKAGNDQERYIHIHPAKYSPFTIRVRSATLKTIVVLEINSVAIQKVTKENLQTINKIRCFYLHLSPVKSVYPEKGILKLWKIFQSSDAAPCT